MSDRTTASNDGREEMNVIIDDKEVEKRVKKYAIEVACVTLQVSDRKIKEGEVVGNGDRINKAGDFVLAANPNKRELIAQEILEGNKAKVGKQVGHKKIDKKAKRSENVDKSKEDKNKPNNGHTER